MSDSAKNNENGTSKKTPDQEYAAPDSAKTGTVSDTSEKQALHSKTPLIGQIAVRHKLITVEELNEAVSYLNEQKKNGRKIHLEDALIEKGYITIPAKTSLKFATLQQLSRQFAFTALKKNIVSKSDIEKAFKFQREKFKEKKLISIADILVKWERITEDQKQDTLKEMLNGDKAAQSPPQPAQTGQKLKSVKEMPPPIGELAVRFNFISQDQLDIVKTELQRRKDAGENIKIDQLLLSKNLLSQKSLDLLHETGAFQRVRLLDQEFCRIALEKGYISHTSAENALAKQLEEFKKSRAITLAGNILIRNGELSGSQMVAICKQQDRIKIPEETAVKKDETPPQLQITLSADKVHALLPPRDKLPFVPDVKAIRKRLDELGICFGIVDDKLIKGYLNMPAFKTASFKVASGKPPVYGKDGDIKYFFDTNYLKAGRISEDGNIDYKDRGEIPVVKAGDTLARKTPPVPGEDGIDIFGNPVTVPEVKDIDLRCGNGAELSDDELTATALIDGQPHATIGGKVSVSLEHIIPGDVGLETGHVRFDGNIIVKGTIKGGFRVTGVNLTADEILDAEINITGDLKVKGGIIGSDVKAAGNIEATYISNAKIDTFGDITIVREIIDSNISTSGACALERGQIISSEIAARKGIEAKQIGTDKSTPCKLRPGAKDHIKKTIETMQALAQQKKEALENLQAKTETLNRKQEQIHKDISAEAQIQDRSEIELRKLKEIMAASEIKKDTISVQESGRRISALEKNIKKADENVARLFEGQDRILDEIIKNQNEMESLVKEIEEIVSEINATVQWDKDNEIVPRLKVSGTIYPKTVIICPRASIVLEDSIRNSTVTQSKISELESETTWGIQILKNER